MHPLEHPADFARALARWFAEQGRDYPWRRTHDPYAILVSEFMLQQTQIATVLGRGFYTRWMEKFPDFALLAAAEEKDVLKAWEGLGYYRRARSLRALARVIMEEHRGKFPRAPEAILALPGIGRYTAGAVASFAFNARAPIVDGNIARVFSRLCDDATPVDSPEGIKRNWQRAEELLGAARSPRVHNSALMELGQMICRPGVPDCGRCPVSSFCMAEAPAGLPIKSKTAVITEITEQVFFHTDEQGVLLEQEAGPRRTGLWKLPALPELPEPPPLLHSSRYAITRYRVKLLVHEAPPTASLRPMLKQPRMKLIPVASLEHIAMPSPYRRALEAVLKLHDFRLE